MVDIQKFQSPIEPERHTTVNSDTQTAQTTTGKDIVKLDSEHESAIVEDQSQAQVLDTHETEPAEVAFNKPPAPPPSDPLSREEIVELLNEVGEGFSRLPQDSQSRLVDTLSDLTLTREQMVMPSFEGWSTVSGLMVSIQQLAATERLTPSIIEAFQELSQTELHSELEPERLSIIQSALHEIAYPERISQHSRGTCVATVPQQLMAFRQPERYLDMVANLASPDGVVDDSIVSSYDVSVRVGEKDDPESFMESQQISLIREPDTLARDNSGRTITSRLIQPAFMEYANRGNTYDNSTDLHNTGGSGLFQDEGNLLLNGIFGENAYEVAYGSGETLLERIEPILEQGEPVPVMVRWSNGSFGNHQVMLTRVDQDTNQAYFVNPWGELDSMALDEFTSRLGAASVPLEPQDLEGDALSNLPGAAGDVSNYEELEWHQYQGATEYIQQDPSFQEGLSSEQSSLLMRLFSTSQLSSFQLTTIESLIDSDALDSFFWSQVEAIDSSEETAGTDLMNLVNLYDAIHGSELSEDFKTGLSEQIIDWLQGHDLSLNSPAFYTIRNLIHMNQFTPDIFQQLQDSEDYQALLEQLDPPKEGVGLSSLLQNFGSSE